MFTQCPECQIAFRVTAKILQQAAGDVRCGGCGHAFSALDYLSEELPENAPFDAEIAEDSSAADRLDDFDAQSKALLQTLDQLARTGEVRTEVSGAESRTPDEDEEVEGGIPEVTEIIDADQSVSQRFLRLDGAAAGAENRLYDDNTPLPDDFDAIDDTPYMPPADKPRRRAADREIGISEEMRELQANLALSEPEEWTDILDEVGAAAVHESPANDVEPAREAGSRPRDNAIPFEVEEELAAIHSELGNDRAASKAATATRDGPYDGAGLPEPTADAVNGPTDAAEVDRDSDDQPGDAGGLSLAESTGSIENHTAAAREASSDDSGKAASESLSSVIGAADAASAIATGADAIPREPADMPAADQSDVLATDEDHAVPAPADDGMSTDYERNQELTIASTQDRLLVQKIAGKDFDFAGAPFNVEAIVMQGDSVAGTSVSDQAKNGADDMVNLDTPRRLVDTYILNKRQIQAGRRRTDPPGAGVYIGIVLLTIALCAQIVHTSRESLAKYGMFNQTVGPLYRALGMPVTPDWNVRGWQFEATNGSGDEAGKALTILSRIVNRSGQSLPYPLLHVSLTDRWEETIGSRVLEPGEYLTGGLDPGKPVAAGDKFTAMISIDGPSPDATGFKLNVCYRLAPGRVRCAIEDFKN